MTCRGRDRELALLVAGELQGTASRLLLEHLATCPACAASERTLRRNAEGLRELGGVTLPKAVEDRFHRRVMERILSEDDAVVARTPRVQRRLAAPMALAACALVAVVLGAAWMLTRRAASGGRPEELAVGTAPPAPASPRPEAPEMPSASGSVGRGPAAPAAPAQRAFTGRPARGTSRPRNVPTRTEHEPMVVRLQTDDPGVVVYWQFENSGG